jgi:hypothetical protein
LGKNERAGITGWAIQSLLTNGYSFQTLQDFIQQPGEKTVIVRHDVDLAYRSQKSQVRSRKSEVTPVKCAPLLQE